MNQKRSWPGVPNRYRIRSWSRVMRPKSMATVVVVLSPVWVRSSMPADADVITASVRSGLISETAPTNVVLPTPKPPATTIFAEVVEREAPPLELAKSTEHPFEQCHVWLAAGALVAAGLMDGDQSASARSATRILATPRGMVSSAEISATDLISRQRLQIR